MTYFTGSSEKVIIAISLARIYVAIGADMCKVHRMLTNGHKLCV